MPRITLRWSDRVQSFDIDELRIGRSTDCDVVIPDERISRDPHLLLRWEGNGWVLVDRSRNGTWSGGQRVERLPINGETTVHLGAPDGIALTVAPAAPVPSAPVSRPPPPPPPAPPGPSHTVALDERALRLNAAGRKLVVPPGYTVTIGRDASCDLVIDSEIVSRQHARFTHDGRCWVLQDLGSTRGTFVDGRRLTRPYRAQGVFEVHLGDDDAGARVQVVTGGVHRAPRRSALPLVIAGAAVGLALVALLATLATRQDPEQAATASRPVSDASAANTDTQLAAVKAATVLIAAVDRSDTVLWSGSGTIISDDGLILTNAHVADPDAPSLEALEEILEGLGGDDPDRFIVLTSPTEDAPVEPRYYAELVATDGDQDAAVIQVTTDYDTGERVSRVPIEPVPIGSSGGLHAGQSIHALGYPDNMSTLSISVVRGEVISFISPEEFEDLGGDRRRIMNTSAVLGEGSSGGPVVRDGKIVGINFTISFESLDRGWAVPVDEVRDLLEEVGI